MMETKANYLVVDDAESSEREQRHQQAFQRCMKYLRKKAQEAREQGRFSAAEQYDADAAEFERALVVISTECQHPASRRKMTLRKRWPNEADWARQEAIAKARKIDNLSRPMLDGEAMTEVERVQRAGQICRAALEIVHALLAAGPQEFKNEL